MKCFGFVHRAATLSAIIASLLCGAGCTGFSHGSSQPSSQTTYVYIGERGNEAISQFQIANDGTLTPLSPASVPDTAGYGPAFLTTEPAQKFLYASGYVSPPVIGQFVIGSDGTIAPNSTPVVNGGNAAYPFTFTPNGQFAISPNIAGNTVSTYSLDATGNLTLVSTLPTCFEPIAPAVDPSGV